MAFRTQPGVILNDLVPRRPNAPHSWLHSLTASACHGPASPVYPWAVVSRSGFALQAPDRVERLALIDSACLDDAIPGGRLAWFVAHVPGLSAIGCWLRFYRGYRICAECL